MADSIQISAVDIKRLWYADEGAVSADLTGAALYALVRENGSASEIKNVHQDTWTIEEGDPTQDSYKNQLTGSTYRMGGKTMGDVTFNFTIGRYDYATKKELMGGEVINTDKGWKRARGIVEVKKCLIALTQDDQYCVLPYANVVAREANTDGAVGIAVVATMLEPLNEAVMPEYWFDASEVKEGVGRSENVALASSETATNSNSYSARSRRVNAGSTVNYGSSGEDGTQPSETLSIL